MVVADSGGAAGGGGYQCGGGGCNGNGGGGGGAEEAEASAGLHETESQGRRRNAGSRSRDHSTHLPNQLVPSNSSVYEICDTFSTSWMRSNDQLMLVQFVFLRQIVYSKIAVLDSPPSTSAYIKFDLSILYPMAFTYSRKKHLPCCSHHGFDFLQITHVF
jgi:hypothetical protein